MFKRIVRRDGSVILLVPKGDTKAVTFEVLYKVGSRQENATNNGASHFVEHLMFKGTKKRPNTIMISRELDGIGAEYNAFTSKEYTGYYITADSQKMAMAVEMLSDMLHNSLFDPKEVDRERGVIIEEINMYEDNPLMHIDDIFETNLYQGSDLGPSIAGPRKNIRNISRQALYNYYQKYYYNGNAIFIVGGKFNTKQALTLVNRYFPVAKKKARVKIKPSVFAKQSRPRIMIDKRDSEQVQLMLGFRTIPGVDKRLLSVQTMANILGGTMSSRLFIEIRERRGLCYSIRATSDAYQDVSSFSVSAGLNKSKIYSALEAIKAELDKLKKDGITKEELAKAKANIRGRLILKMEDTHNYLHFLAAQELFGQKLKTLETKLAEVDKITLKQINDMAKSIINWPQVSMSIIGPFNDKNKFTKILNK